MFSEINTDFASAYDDLIDEIVCFSRCLFDLIDELSYYSKQKSVFKLLIIPGKSKDL